METARKPHETFRSLWNRIRPLPLATLAGLALTALFLVFCKIDTYVVRWWLMLPLAAAAGGLLLWRRTRAPPVESRICSVGLCLLLALFLLRDIGMSKKLATLLDTVDKYKTQVDQTTRAINRFFDRPPSPPR